LASGILTGKYNDGVPQDSRMNLQGYEWLRDDLAKPAGLAKLVKVRALADLAKGVGIPIHHLALLWCLANPHVSTVILGASRLSQLKDNLDALENKAKMTPDVLASIEDIMGNKPAAAQRF
jgi:aryl-alcohol dehydrogenase-like predicted oxidoreductase